MTQEEAFKLFDELPPPIAERAKRNTPSNGLRFHTSFRGNPVSVAVAIAFRWADTREGSDFWLRVADAAEFGRDYPSVKGLPA